MTSKLEVACELLDRALVMYYEGNSYYASLNLAGGADLVLGKFVSATKEKNSYESIKDASVRISKLLDDDGIEIKESDIHLILNDPYNSTKHMSGIKDATVSFDAKTKAEEMLDRAVSNFYQLMSMSLYLKEKGHTGLKETDLIRRFNNQFVSR